MFNCHLDLVLLIITKERDYFLIGESKECVDHWYNVMYSVLLCEFPSSFHGSGVAASSSKPVPYPRSLFTDTTSVEPPQFRRPQLPVAASSSKPVPYPRSLFMDTTSVEPPQFRGPQLPVAASSSKPVPYPRSLFTDTTSVEPPQFRGPQLPESGQLDTENPSMKINPLNLVKIEEKDVQVNLEDLKNCMKISDIDGRCCITQWRGAPHVRHLFCRGDRILAVNDLRTETAKDVELYLNKVMKTQVKMKIQRTQESQL
ncbi:pleckstrin homology domain-containing family S member 1 isoform X2 [Polypterus senegalus]|uniref:pleckstrin homology domain-containing family S member 1 isoform X2 n=1 Tax=Polypterus senegalus TaxID=55291 RepID=UPI00196614D1|nr:pleckstrin homology domain-containing family S member 1 isoform X2 [Polypterus senegalus]